MATRRKLAKKGQTAYGTSFPVPNVAYLKKALQAVGRAPAGKRATLAAFLRRRARALGAMNVIKGSWADNTQSAKSMSNALREALELSGYTGEELLREIELTRQAFASVELARKRTQSTTANQTASDQTDDEGPQSASKKQSKTFAAASKQHTADAQRDQMLFKRVHDAMTHRGMPEAAARKAAARAVKLRRKSNSGKA
jgi:hypothetical protein